MTQAKPTEAKNGAEPPKAAATIDERIRWVQANVSAVDKTGTVEFGRTKYDVMQEHGIFAVLGPLLDRAGLSTNFGLAPDFPDSYVKEGNAALIICKLTVRDDKGEERVGYFPAEGIDSADKASPKALTMASKYAYQKFFRVPTDKVDDADSTSSAEHEQKGTGGGASRPKGGRQRQQTNDKLSPQKVKVLRETAKAAVDAGHIDQKRIFASLQTHGVEKVEDLTKEQGDAFAKWLEAELAGTPDATQLSTDAG
jgi:hypothetical protein